MCVFVHTDESIIRNHITYNEKDQHRTKNSFRRRNRENGGDTIFFKTLVKNSVCLKKYMLFGIKKLSESQAK